MVTPAPYYDVALQLLDRQVVASNGRLVCNVDDLDLVVDENGRPVVTALLVGPGVLGPRVGGVVGRAMTAVWRRLARDPDPKPGRIPIELVSKVESAIRLSVDKDELVLAGIDGFETWVREAVINRIPGAGHDAE